MGSLSGVAKGLSTVLTGLPATALTLGSDVVAREKRRSDMQQAQSIALDQLKSRQAQEETLSFADADQQKQKIATESAETERRRKAALRSAVARQKTLFAAQGIDAGDPGSSEAVLLGLYNDSGDEKSASQYTDNLRRAALDDSLAKQRQRNLLETSQLAERQRFAFATGGY